MIDNDFVTSAYGVRCPGIIYGTAWKKTQTLGLVSKAIALGFRGIDTACQPKHYDEAGVGAGVCASLQPGLSRADLYLQTKFTPLTGQDPSRVPYDAKARLAEQVTQSFRRSLLNLQTDYLDCLILHSPLSDPQRMTEVWQAMEALFDARGARQLGISNCYDVQALEHLYRSTRIKPAVVQNRFYAQTHYDADIRAFCLDHRITYQSFWTLTANPQLLAHGNVSTLAAKYGRTPAQILFRYLTRSGVVPLAGPRSEQHMREDLAIFDFELAEDERNAITALLK
jgi:diketogulonate reductase-like aldo/keto reductase